MLDSKPIQVEETHRSRSLALRRHHNARIKKKRSRYASVSGSSVYNERAIGRATNTPANCSCWICANPRRIKGLRTIQEQREMQVEISEELMGLEAS